jgi:opacity protein-like surface antigen
MKRCACVAFLWLMGTLCAGAAFAQAPASGADEKMYAEFNLGPTLGHKSSTFVGVEGGYRIVPDIDVFVEVGHMQNVGTDALEANAATVAGFLGGTVTSTSISATYVNAGIRYHLSLLPRWHPYVLGGIGGASVATRTTFAVNGTEIDPNTFVTPEGNSVQLGGDLAGSRGKVMIVAGFGVNVPFLQRYYADVGYRYGQILARTSQVETDTSVKTQRVVVGIGVRF